ncbi:MAG: SIMPL domain-containing protein [Bacteroidia bacterium]|nr:SIMPL domain-containing protein [Bacteroidia bacterium]
MRIKIGIAALLCLICTLSAEAQSLGNANYQARSINRKPELPKIVRVSNDKEITLSVNAMYNTTASSYVAVFSLTQVGESIEETDKLMNDRINKIKDGIQKLELSKTRVYVDMISLVPVYEYEVSKKIFSKNTYTEVPRGFELKKNLHIRYIDHEALDKILSICAKNEVYDLVKVDYFVENTEAIYDTLRSRAAGLIKEKIKFYQDLGVDLSEKRRIISEGDQAFFPVERYTSYQAFANYSLEARAKSEIKKVTKSTAQYYRPVPSRKYDIVINPEIVEPVIQYTYSLNVRFFLEDKKPKPQPIIKAEPKKEVFLILPNGGMKKLEF